MVEKCSLGCLTTTIYFVLYITPCTAIFAAPMSILVDCGTFQIPIVCISKPLRPVEPSSTQQAYLNVLEPAWLPLSRHVYLS
jgi:hypothetical protein